MSKYQKSFGLGVDGIVNTSMFTPIVPTTTLPTTTTQSTGSFWTGLNNLLNNVGNTIGTIQNTIGNTVGNIASQNANVQYVQEPYQPLINEMPEEVNQNQNVVEEKDNTLLYAGLGFGALLAIGTAVYIVKNK
jgi:hypothetical protein